MDLAAAVMSRVNGHTGRGEFGTVLVVDDDRGASDLLREVLERAGMSTIGLSSGAEVLEEVRRERPAVVILEVSLPDVNGLEVCRSLRSELGDSLAIVLTSGERTDALDRTTGIMLGADDYIVQPFDHDELVARVRRLAQRALSTNQASAALGGLTPRELEVLRLLAEGRRPAEIANALVISPKTVSNHIQRLFAKLGVHSQSQAVALAYHEGLLEADVRAHKLELTAL